VRDIGITSAMYGRVFFVSLTTVAALATAMVYGVGGVLAAQGSLASARWWRWRVPHPAVRPLTALSNVRVDVMTAPRQLRARLSRCSTSSRWCRTARRDALPSRTLSVEFDDVVFAYPTAQEVSLASLESVARLDTTPSTTVLHGVSFRAEAGELVALVGRRCRQDDHQPAGHAHVDVSRAPCGIGGTTSAT
jgi:ATP-binding cassette subfamily B protein